MTDLDTAALDGIAAREDLASQYVAELCSGKRQWRMRVPVDPADTDIVLSASLADIGPLVAEVRRLRDDVARVREERDAAVRRVGELHAAGEELRDELNRARRTIAALHGPAAAGGEQA